MTNGSIDIDGIQGDVSGIIKDSIGSIAAKAFNNYGTLVINNATKEDLATLTRIRNIPAGSDAIEKGIVTKEEFNALRLGVDRILSLLEGNQANSIKAGNVEISRTELSTHEIADRAKLLVDNARYGEAIQMYNEVAKQNVYMAFDAYIHIAYCHNQLGQYRDALRALDDAEKVNYCNPQYQKYGIWVIPYFRNFAIQKLRGRNPAKHSIYNPQDEYEYQQGQRR
jgi:tetratricopeptide (TPR) repeat protein